ncbi:MAG: hypothetical protein WCG27_05465 [Pseudomonadota bacterium]
MNKRIIQILFFIMALLFIARAPLAQASAKTLYDHTYSKLAATTVSNYWDSDNPMNSQIAGFIYTGDGARPSNYFRDVSVLVGTVGLDGKIDGGDIKQVQKWKLFIFDMGDRALMKNNFSLANMQDESKYFTMYFRHPTNSVWASPIGTQTTTGMKIYYLTFSIWTQKWLPIKNHVYVMGVLPVFKGNNRPFYVQQFVSSGMDPWNSTYLGSGTNAAIMHNKTLELAGLPSLFFPDPTLCLFNMCPGNSFLMGAAVDQDTPPPFVTPAKVTNLTVSGTTVTVTFGPTFTGHTYKVDISSDLKTWNIDNTYIAGTNNPITRTYTGVTDPMKYYRVITDGLHPSSYNTLIKAP